MLAFFRHQNGRAFSPPLPIAALLRRRLGGNGAKIAQAGMLHCGLGGLAAQKDRKGNDMSSVARAPVLAFFRRQNGRAFFPSLPIAARLRRRLGGGEGQIARVRILPRGAAAFAR